MPDRDAPIEDVPLEELAQRLREGRDDEAFHQIFISYYPQVHRYFERKNVPVGDCADLTQEVFFSVYRNMDTLRDPSSFPGWLFAIARNTFAGYLDRKHAAKRQVTVVEPLDPATGRDPIDLVPSSVPSALHEMMDREKVERLREALQELPDQMRRCVTIRVLEELPYDQIAQRLSISVNTVKVHLHHAKKALSRKLRPYFGEVEI